MYILVIVYLTKTLEKHLVMSLIPLAFCVSRSVLTSYEKYLYETANAAPYFVCDTCVIISCDYKTLRLLCKSPCHKTVAMKPTIFLIDAMRIGLP